jgi:hypothetical protein
MYKPENKWQTDDNLVYNLKHKGWLKGKSQMINDVAVNIMAHDISEDDKKQIAKIICDALNNFYFKNSVQQVREPDTGGAGETKGK